MNKQILTEKLISCIQEHLTEEIELIDEEFPIMGSHFFDSFDVVSILTSFEADINDSFDIDITLSSERALSMKNSPFLNIKSLVEFTIETIEEYE
tara:strand:+ start:606 stop:890 length:285 start_codon:yes stop_codon:yes gene_type:complete